MRLITLLLTSFILLSNYLTTSKLPTLQLVFIGDSITHGTEQDNQSPPIFAAEFLYASNKFHKVDLSNQGVSGYTTVDFLPVTNKAFKNVKAAAGAFTVNTNATLVFSIMLGTNDSAIKGPTGSPISPRDYRYNLKVLVDTLLQTYPKCKVVLNYPIWYSTNTQNTGAAYLQEGADRLLAYWPEIDDLLINFDKVSPGRVYTGDKSAYTFFKKNHLENMKAEHGKMGTFYLHPNKNGDKALGEFWAKAILSCWNKFQK